MPNELPIPATNKQAKSKTARTLIQAAALAAVLVPLGTVALEAEPITCGFGFGEYGDGSGTGCLAEGPYGSTFNFGDYFFELEFSFVDNVQDFEVTVNNITFSELSGESFPGYECIALTDAGCVDFEVSTTGALGTHWDHYTVAIDWTDWNDLLDESMEPRIRMLHDRGVNLGGDGPEEPGTYDFDMCVTAGYDNCEAEFEPRIRSGDTDFNSFTAALAPAQVAEVPEPSSLVLLGTGAFATLFRNRRRSRV